MNKSVKRILVTLITISGLMGILIPSRVIAGNLGMDFNDDVARIFFMQKFRRNNLSGNVSLLHQEDGGNVIAGGLHVIEEYREGTYLGLGVQLEVFDADLESSSLFDDSGVALAVGGFGRWAFPTLSALGIGADIHYAPGVLAFGDTESYLEYAVRLEFQALRSTNIFLGYRRVEIEMEDIGDIEFEKGAFIGARLTF